MAKISKLWASEYYGRQMKQYYECCNCHLGCMAKRKMSENLIKFSQFEKQSNNNNKQTNKQNNNKLPKKLSIHSALRQFPWNEEKWKHKHGWTSVHRCSKEFLHNSLKLEIIKCLSKSKWRNSGVFTNVVWFINKSNEILIYTMWPKE